MFTNSNIPYLDNSLPNPLFFIPPNGTLGSETTILLTVTIPDSTIAENLSAFSKSSPYSCTKTKFRIICNSYGFLFIIRCDYWCNRAKDFFFLYYFHIREHILKDSWTVEIASDFDSLCACKEFSSFF